MSFSIFYPISASNGYRYNHDSRFGPPNPVSQSGFNVLLASESLVYNAVELKVRSRNMIEK